jgi:endonuclease G
MAIALIVIGVVVFRFAPLPPPPTIDSPHLLLGNPSGATASVAQPDNFLIVRPQYELATQSGLAG